MEFFMNFVPIVLKVWRFYGILKTKIEQRLTLSRKCKATTHFEVKCETTVKFSRKSEASTHF